MPLVCEHVGLDVDIRQFLDRDNSRVGSKGIWLIGGQKQRLVCVKRVCFLFSELLFFIIS